MTTCQRRSEEKTSEEQQRRNLIMARLIEWNPFKEMEKLRGEFDRVRNPSWLGEELAADSVHPRIESFIEDGKLTVRADLPGIDPKEIEVKVIGNMLEVRGKREEKKE